MKPVICSKCKKNVAVVFITKVENGKSTDEGLCLKCAKELGIKQVDDMVARMGITEDDLESINYVSVNTDTMLLDWYRTSDLMRIGAPVDYYFHNDMARPDMPDYKLYITNAEITGSLWLSGRFKIYYNGGLAFQWIGGEA